MLAPIASMIHWKPLERGLQNPPTDTQILLRAIDGSWGIGVAYKHKNTVIFDYCSKKPTRVMYDEPKSSFNGWSPI